MDSVTDRCEVSDEHGAVTEMGKSGNGCVDHDRVEVLEGVPCIGMDVGRGASTIACFEEGFRSCGFNLLRKT
jgi:hypothetical protein